MNIIPGSYVTHAKLPELGNGEVMSAQDGNISIRFASGSRAFKLEFVIRHLLVTLEAPPAPQKAKRARKAPSAKATAKAAPKAAAKS